jgi:hypothetical protein
MECLPWSMGYFLRRAHSSREGRKSLWRAHSWEKRCIKLKERCSLRRFSLVEERRTLWEMEGAWQGRAHSIVEFLLEEGRT